MITKLNLNHHFKPKSGWMNDPNGLVYFQGYYHAFYQCAPHYEQPWKEPMYWGHARTKDFITWEELPLALCPDQPYDNDGCWSGTAIVKDEVLYLFYASVLYDKERKCYDPQTVSVARSTDGIHFEKCTENPVISTYPSEGNHEFRDPAVMYSNGQYYLVMATGHDETQSGRLLLYASQDLIHWTFHDVMCQWPDARFCECPSFMKYEDHYLLTTSVVQKNGKDFFSIMYGDFDGHNFHMQTSADILHGPDQYAGQLFVDPFGRHILLSWISGWSYSEFAEKSLGCLSLPIEITVKNGKIYGYPVKEVQHLLKDSDPAVKLTEDGFVVERTLRKPVVHRGEIHSLKILRDEYVLEIFINGGEHIYMIILC